MSVHTIVTRGYAGTDNYKIPTLGYTSGESVGVSVYGPAKIESSRISAAASVNSCRTFSTGVATGVVN